MSLLKNLTIHGKENGRIYPSILLLDSHEGQFHAVKGLIFTERDTHSIFVLNTYVCSLPDCLKNVYGLTF